MTSLHWAQGRQTDYFMNIQSINLELQQYKNMKMNTVKLVFKHRPLVPFALKTLDYWIYVWLIET